MRDMTDTPIPSGRDLLALIDDWTDLTLARRKGLAGSVRFACRVGGHGRHPELVRFDPATIIPMLQRASPAALGVSAGRLACATSDVRAVLRRVGLLRPRLPRPPVTDPRWTALIAARPRPGQTRRLEAFMRWCAGRGRAPDEVTSDDIAAYLEERRAAEGGKNLRANVGEAVRQWNKACDAVPGWPGQRLTLPPAEDRQLALPFTSYPPALRAEVEAFRERLGRPSVNELLPEVPLAGLSAASVQTYTKGLRLALWGLVGSGTPPHKVQGLAHLVEPDAIKALMRWHFHRLDGQAKSAPKPVLDTIASAILAVAGHVELGDRERATLARLLRPARRRRQREMTARVAELMDRLDDPATRRRVITLPPRLLDLATRLRDGDPAADVPPRPAEAAQRAAVAAAIEILLRLPVRVSDLARLRLGHEIVLTEQRGRPRCKIRVDTAKTDALVETEFGGEGAALLHAYAAHFRPLGPSPCTDWLFPHRDRADRPRTAHHLSEAVADMTERHAGVRLPAHSFRSLVVELVGEDSANALEDARLLLGHAGYDVAARHYRRAQRRAAAERASAAIDRRRLAPVGVEPTRASKAPAVGATGPALLARHGGRGRGGPRRSRPGRGGREVGP